MCDHVSARRVPGRGCVLVWACVGQADSGNCKVRLVDFHTGNVVTRWGTACLAAGARSDGSRYVDSPISARNTLGSHLALAWVSWYPPPPRPPSLLISPQEARTERERENHWNGVPDLRAL